MVYLLLWTLVWRKPGEGMHHYRLCTFALVDAIPTIIIISVIIENYFKWDVWKALLVMFIINIICLRSSVASSGEAEDMERAGRAPITLALGDHERTFADGHWHSGACPVCAN
jgi:hypothetical protein